MPQGGPVKVGAADDAYERDAAGSLASNIASPGKSAAAVPVQRYQAGEMGHGGIEAEALKAAGFSGTMTTGDIGAIYFGNWLRDFSQVGDPHDPRILTLLNILALGEFNRPVTAEQVGGYLPSEHLDNPVGGESMENPDPSFKPKETTIKALSASQNQWVNEEKGNQKKENQEKKETKTLKDDIRDRARTTHLPGYIEAGKEHARREFMIALSKPKDDPDRMIALGNGLHTIEDYFAHSNFTEACIYLLVADGMVPETSSVFQRLKARALRFGYDPSGGIAGAQAEMRPEIMTGTYAPAGNERVSLLEQLATEVQTGSLRDATVRGTLRLASRDPGALDALIRYPLGAAVGGAEGAVLGGAGGAVKGAFEQGETGAARGLAGGWRKGWPQLADNFVIYGGAISAGILTWDVFSGMVSGGAKGLKEGAEQGWGKGYQWGGEEGAKIGAATEGLIGAAIITGIVSLINTIIAAAKGSLITSAVAGGIEEAEVQKQTEVAGGFKSAAAAPSHSQLAKDDPDHPVYDVSRQLAVYVDTEIGMAMKHAWEAGSSPESAARVTGLVDRFVCNPADSAWWRKPLLHALEHPGSISSAPE